METTTEQTDMRPLTMPSDAARAVGRFDPDTPTRYVAAGGGHHLIRDTRAEAEADWIAGQYAIPARNVSGDLLVMCSRCSLPVYDSHKDGLCGGCRPVDTCCEEGTR